jgi:hypothetical protein
MSASSVCGSSAQAAREPNSGGQEKEVPWPEACSEEISAEVGKSEAKAPCDGGAVTSEDGGATEQEEGLANNAPCAIEEMLLQQIASMDEARFSPIPPRRGACSFS